MRTSFGLTLFLALTLGASAFADPRPETLVCLFDGTSLIFSQKITFTNFHTRSVSVASEGNELYSDDASWEVNESAPNFSASFSNECDYIYTFTFVQEELRKLVAREVASIKANYKGEDDNLELVELDNLTCSLP